MFDEAEVQKLVQEMNQNGEPEQPNEDSEQPEELEQDEDEQLDEETEGEVGDDEEDSEGEDDDDDDQDEQPETDSSKDEVITWKTRDGQQISVTKSELQNGYLRQQDYTRKAQELAKERETIAKQQQEGIQQVQQYATELAQLQQASQYVQQLEQSIAKMDSEADPIGYNAAVNKLLMAKENANGLASRLQQVHQQRTFEQQNRMVEAQKQAVTELSEGPNALPDFGPELVQRLNDTGKSYGITDEELSQIVDPRYIRVLHDAMKYRELQSKKPKAVKKARSAPRQVRSVQEPRVAKTLKQFDSNPTIEGMAALLSTAKR